MLVCFDLLSLFPITDFLYSSMYKTNSTTVYASDFAASEQTPNPCVVIPAFLTLANLTAVSSKEEMQDLALSRSTCKSTRVQMGNSSSYGNNGWDMRTGRSQTTPPTTSSAYTRQQVSEVTNTQLEPPAPFVFFQGREPYKGTGPRHKRLQATWQTSTSLRELVYCQKSIWQRKSGVRFCSHWHLGNPKKVKWELRKITDKQSTEDMAVPWALLPPTCCRILPYRRTGRKDQAFLSSKPIE